MSSTVNRRGAGVKPAMVHTNVRLPEHVVDYFKNNFTNYTAEIRRVLEAHVDNELVFGDEPAN